MFACDENACAECEAMRAMGSTLSRVRWSSGGDGPDVAALRLCSVPLGVTRDGVEGGVQPFVVLRKNGG